MPIKQRRAVVETAKDGVAVEQRQLDFATFGDVGQAADEPGNGARRITQWLGRGLHPYDIAIGTLEAIFGLESLAGLDRPVPLLQHPRPVIGMQRVHPARPQGRRLGEPGDVAPRRVDEDVAAVASARKRPTGAEATSAPYSSSGRRLGELLSSGAGEPIVTRRP